MNEKQADYLAYMLRVWRTQRDGTDVWRVCLKSAQTRECKHFASLEQLFDYLRQRAGASSSAAEAESVASQTAL